MCPYEATNDKHHCNQFYRTNIGSKPTQATMGGYSGGYRYIQQMPLQAIKKMDLYVFWGKMPPVLRGCLTSNILQMKKNVKVKTGFISNIRIRQLL